MTCPYPTTCDKTISEYVLDHSWTPRVREELHERVKDRKLCFYHMGMIRRIMQEAEKPDLVDSANRIFNSPI